MKSVSQGTNIVICGVPLISPFRPAPAPAVLKSAVEKTGEFTCKTRDLNIEMYDEGLKDSELMLEMTGFSQMDGRYLEKDLGSCWDLFNLRLRECSGRFQNFFSQFLQKKAESIIAEKADWVGISIFSPSSHMFSVALCSKIKDLRPEQQIVLGGNGVGKFRFGEKSVKEGLADAIIYGEGELSLVELLRRNFDYPGINQNNPIQIENLDDLPFPNYDDFDLNKYQSAPAELPITASRGCVRNCTFCDVRFSWKSYRQRSAESIAGEILYLWERYSIFEFSFTDSLINGNLKQFRKLCELLSQWIRLGRLPEELYLSGQFICWRKSMFTEDLYELMVQAGFKEIFIGIESGSDRVLKDMRKGIRGEDIDAMMQNLHKYKIACHLLFIVGYPTETKEDFEKTLEMLDRYRKYSDLGTLISINLSKTLAILEGSPLHQKPEKWGISDPHPGNWVSEFNPSLDRLERIRRRLIIHKVAENLDYKIRWPMQHLSELNRMADDF